MNEQSYTLLQSRLCRLAEELDARAMSQSSALIREAVNELGELQHEIAVSNELLSDVVIRPGPNFPQEAA